MLEQHIMARLETSMAKAFNVGQTTQSFWINGCQRLQRLTKMDMSAPVLMFPIVGHKKIVAEQQVFDAKPGEILMLPKGIRCDVENIPELGHNRFLGASLVFDQQTIDLFGKAYSDGLKYWELTPKWKATGSNEAYSLITDWLAHDQKYSADITQTRHRLVELLLVLTRQGLAGNLLLSRGDTLSERVTQHFMTDLSRDWSLNDLTATLAMSERTLRRRLKTEKTGFRDLLEDARLNR